MPYTLVHPAAVIPLSRGRLVPSALIAGAMIPDLFRSVGTGADRLSHQWLSTVTLSPLLALVFLAAFHLVLKWPVLDLAPASLRRGLAGPARGFRLASPADAFFVWLSTAIGAATHVLWDAFTHGDFIGWSGDPVIAGFNGIQLVQDGSSVVGLAVIVVWLVRWYRRAPEGVAPAGLGHRNRITARIVLSTTAAAAALYPLLFPSRPFSDYGVDAGKLAWNIATDMLLSAVSVTLLALTAYALLHRLTCTIRNRTA
ncbi:DUF4184 family protein [Streptomyces sp. NPDC052496]|uniref:DUF4184 family protein n=1 Tax=Streptomyces sp. NPDC052496 TaxID=3154951 RepID=UPI0034151E12